MPSFVREIRTIKLLLAGSGWATDTETRIVLDEYDRFVGASRIRNVERRASLQIFNASRAIDSLLAHVVRWECNRLGRSPLRNGRMPKPTIGESINFIQNFGINGGQQFPSATKTKLNDVKDQRNKYMHQAGVFPNDSELSNFLNETASGIQDVA